MSLAFVDPLASAAEALDYDEDEGALPPTAGDADINTAVKTVLYCNIVPENMSLSDITKVRLGAGRLGDRH